MLTLAINTASSQTAIALFEDKKLVEENSWHSNNDEAEKLMPSINNLLGQRGFDEVEEVFVVKGPGSFTGLRVGVTVANTLSYLTGAKLYAISAFDYWRLLYDIPILIYAGSKGIYLSEKNKEVEIINMDDLNQALAKRDIKKVHGDISDEQKSMLKAEFINSDKSFGEVMQEIITQRHTPEKIVKPLYIKPPSITQSKKHAVHSLNTNR